MHSVCSSYKALIHCDHIHKTLMCSIIDYCNVLLQSGKLSRQKTFMNFAVWSHPQKFSPRNLGVPYPPMLGFSFCDSFLRKTVTLTRSMKIFSLETFPLAIYTVYIIMGVSGPSYVGLQSLSVASLGGACGFICTQSTHQYIYPLQVLLQDCLFTQPIKVHALFTTLPQPVTSRQASYIILYMDYDEATL